MKLSKGSNARFVDARLHAAEEAMGRLRATFMAGQNRHGEYGRHCREAFDRHAAVYADITTKKAPSIYD